MAISDPRNLYVNPAAVANLDNLYNDTRDLFIVAGDVTLAAGASMARGTALDRDGGNAYIPAVENIRGVLLEDVSSTAGGTFSVPIATAGGFNQNVMTLDTLDDVDEAIADARDRNILIRPQHQAPFVGLENF
jgi:hypothetical protein